MSFNNYYSAHTVSIAAVGAIAITAAVAISGIAVRAVAIAPIGAIPVVIFGPIIIIPDRARFVGRRAAIPTAATSAVL